MMRDFVISVIGHCAFLGGIILISNHSPNPIPLDMNIYRVQTVSAQSIQTLLDRNNPAPPARPKPAVPQVVAKEKTVPQENRKKSQAVKNTTPTPASPTTVAKGSTQTTGNPVQGIQTDSVFNYPDYLLDLRDRIQEHWRPPVVNRNLATRVYFQIARDGKISRVRVESPSGNMAFDRSAQQAVIACDPFDPLPAEFTENQLGVHFDFIYSVD